MLEDETIEIFLLKLYLIIIVLIIKDKYAVTEIFIKLKFYKYINIFDFNSCIDYLIYVIYNIKPKVKYKVNCAEMQLTRMMTQFALIIATGKLLAKRLTADTKRPLSV